MNYFKQGFTLVEILLVMAALGILTTIWIVAFDPLDNIDQTVAVRTQADMANIQKALQQYLFDNETYPEGIPSDSNNPQHICNTGDETEFTNPTDCAGLLDLRVMVPSAIDEIPRHPERPEFSQGTGYALQRNSANRVEVVLWQGE